MAIVSKTVDKQFTISAAEQLLSADLQNLLKREPKLQKARELMAKGEHELALSVLPPASRDIEIRNVCAVCMMRTNRYVQAVDVLRTVALNTKINRVRNDIPPHIQVNFAIALFFGGQPAGALEALQEIDREDLPSVVLLREHAAAWVASMGFFRRLDWKMNRVAPKQLPILPNDQVRDRIGVCAWDMA